MKKNTWTWSIGYEPDNGHFVALYKDTLWTEIKAYLAGPLLRYGWTYPLGNRMVIKIEMDREPVYQLYLTQDEAKKLGWDL